MRYAYGWAALNPIKKIYYNLTVTVMSILVAFVIGSIEFLTVISSEFDLHGSIWGALGNLGFDLLGYVIIALFIGTWLLAMLVYKLGHYEEAWSTPPEAVPEVS